VDLDLVKQGIGLGESGLGHGNGSGFAVFYVSREACWNRIAILTTLVADTDEPNSITIQE